VSLYAERVAIHPKRAHGTFRNLKWLVMGLTLGVYYITPWLRWDRGPVLPDQAVLIDFSNQRLFFGPLEIWAQEFYYVTGLLVLASLALFLVTALAGRVWCGYACPQTVWTDLFIAVERLIQGDRNARLRLQKAPWSSEKIGKLAATHAIWLFIALLTGGAFVFYFRDAPTLAYEFATGTAPYIAYVFVGVFAGFTYLLGGLAREQVCIYMCPWPRIQGAMFDDHSLLVSYRPARGEPRGPHKKGETWEGRGECIDCKQCVVVCPMGIDIRDGPQLECIQCALCIDACNEIMDKIGRPRGLIRYDTVAKQEAHATGGEEQTFKLIRTRTLLYAGVIGIVAAVMLVAMSMRTTLEVNVYSDRAPLFVRLSDGGIRNGYTVKILNKAHEPRNVTLRTKGLDGATMRIVGFESSNPTITLPTDNLRELKIFVSVPAGNVNQLTPPSTPFEIIVNDKASDAEMVRRAVFQSPAR
jgi:cytochrome c oxidase accessory protein FixG